MDDEPQTLARLTYPDDTGPAINVRWAHVDGRPTAWLRVGSSEAVISDQALAVRAWPPPSQR